MAKVAVMGAGSWGTTLAKVFADAGSQTVVWARRKELADAINADHVNADYLPSTVLPASLRATSSPEEALDGAEIVVFGVPSQTLRSNLSSWRSSLPRDATLVSLAKGIEKGTLMRMSQVIGEVSGAPAERIAVLSGPNLAKEIAQEQPAATLIACPDHDRAKQVQEATSTSYLRPYTNTDVVGVELGGACKNVIALASGMAAGLGNGYNTAATLITRGIAEITRLGVELGADPRTLSGLSGLGDLVATCASPLSRNRTFGFQLGEGGSLEEAMKGTHGQVAEGVISSASIHELAVSHGVDMPITTAVYKVCHEGMHAKETIAMLMGRSMKAE